MLYTRTEPATSEFLEAGLVSEHYVLDGAKRILEISEYAEFHITKWRTSFTNEEGYGQLLQAFRLSGIPPAQATVTAQIGGSAKEGIPLDRFTENLPMHFLNTSAVQVICIGGDGVSLYFDQMLPEQYMGVGASENIADFCVDFAQRTSATLRSYSRDELLEHVLRVHRLYPRK